MYRILKTSITYGLSVLFLIGTFHFDLQNHTYSEGYSICEISCDEDKHQSSPHLCEKCLNKDNRLISPHCSDLVPKDAYKISLLLLDQNFITIFSYFNLYSRPPPLNLI